MLQPLFEGLLTGIALSLMLGTVFFFIIQNSLDHGFKTGFLIAVGVVVSDLILIAISLLGSEMMPSFSGFKTAMTCIAAALLFMMGYRSFTKNSSALWTANKGDSRALFLAANGFILNIINPANAVNWFAIALYLKDVEQYNTLQRTLFFSGTLITIVLTEVAIAWGASALKRFLSEKVLQWINRITGIIFISFALYLIYPLLVNLLS
jgi:threonine/homoserine/homoserine lactone efflux protein